LLIYEFTFKTAVGFDVYYFFSSKFGKVLIVLQTMLGKTINYKAY